MTSKIRKPAKRNNLEKRPLPMQMRLQPKSSSNNHSHKLSLSHRYSHKCKHSRSNNRLSNRNNSLNNNLSKPKHKRKLLSKSLNKLRLILWKPWILLEKYSQKLRNSRPSKWLNNFWRMFKDRQRKELAQLKMHQQAVKLKLKSKSINKLNRTTKNSSRVRRISLNLKKRKPSMKMK